MLRIEEYGGLTPFNEDGHSDVIYLGGEFYPNYTRIDTFGVPPYMGPGSQYEGAPAAPWLVQYQNRGFDASAPPYTIVLYRDDIRITPDNTFAGPGTTFYSGPVGGSAFTEYVGAATYTGPTDFAIYDVERTGGDPYIAAYESLYASDYVGSYDVAYETQYLIYLSLIHI